MIPVYFETQKKVNAMLQRSQLLDVSKTNIPEMRWVGLCLVDCVEP